MEVVNVRKKNLNKLGYRDLQHWLEDPNHVYIGRNMAFYVKGAVQSKWANPFSVKKWGREGALEEYRKHILGKEELLNDLIELDGMVLGCWVDASAGCHGDVLVELVKERRDKLREEKDD